MQPLTHEKLAANAYRTLGISASMDLAAIEDAARRMRIWADPLRIPPTEWDFLPWLGPVARSRGDIEQALAILNEPKSRIEQRLLWYHGPRPPDLNAVPGDPPDTNSDLSETHNRNLAALHLACTFDPDVHNAERWKGVMEAMSDLSRSPRYATWLQQTELDGQFEKQASLDEITKAAHSVVAALAMALVPKAQAALDRDDLGACAGIVSLLRNAGSSAEFARPIKKLLDGLEDTLTRLCEEIDAELRDKLETNRSMPQSFYAANRAASEKGTKFYNERIEPILNHLKTLAGDEAHRLMRVRSRCADVLHLLAWGWEHAGEFDTAVLTLRMALELVEDGPAASAMRADMMRCFRLAEQQREAAALSLRVNQQATTAIHDATGSFSAGGNTFAQVSVPAVPSVPMPPRRRPARRPASEKIALGALAFIFLAIGLIFVRIYFAVQTPSAPHDASNGAVRAPDRDTRTTPSEDNGRLPRLLFEPIPLPPIDATQPSPFGETSREP